MPRKHNEILGPKDRGGDVGREIDRETPSPEVKRRVARDLEEHADDPIHSSDEPMKTDGADETRTRH